MNILILNDEDTLSTIEQLKSIMELDWKLFFPNSFKESEQLYKTNNFDFVIIDFVSENNTTLLDNILKDNPKQKIITLSQTLKCSDTYGCDNCRNNFNKRRILKPFKLKELYETIVNFDNLPCKYYNGFENKLVFIDQIIEKYKSCQYNSEAKTIECSVYNSSNIKDFLDLEKLLESHNIPFRIEGSTFFL